MFRGGVHLADRSGSINDYRRLGNPVHQRPLDHLVPARGEGLFTDGRQAARRLLVRTLERVQLHGLEVEDHFDLAVDEERHGHRRALAFGGLDEAVIARGVGDIVDHQDRFALEAGAQHALAERLVEQSLAGPLHEQA